jgi:4-hydroxy-tetrahydrodipicolinate synthase
MAKTLKGLIPVGITPFDEQGVIDLPSLRNALDFWIEAGVNGIAYGFNGSEFHTLSDDERRTLIKAVVEIVGHRVPVMIGVTGASAQPAAELARFAEQCGADSVGALPSYIRVPMSLAEIEQYYRSIAGAVNLPVVIQNALPPAGVPMPADFIARLIREVEHIEYVKEETRNPGHTMATILRLAGDDCKGVLGGLGGHYVLDEFRRGACGTMPFPHLPEVQAAQWGAMENGDWVKARGILYRLLPLYNMETPFGVVLCKEILHRRSIIASAATRIPSPARMDQVDREELTVILNELRDLLTSLP